MFDIGQGYVKSAHEEGMKAFSDGKEMWECPYVTPSSPVLALGPWIAGWMYAKQLAEHSKKSD